MNCTACSCRLYAVGNLCGESCCNAVLCVYSSQPKCEANKARVSRQLGRASHALGQGLQEGRSMHPRKIFRLGLLFSSRPSVLPWRGSAQAWRTHCGHAWGGGEAGYYLLLKSDTIPALCSLSCRHFVKLRLQSWLVGIPPMECRGIQNLVT